MFPDKARIMIFTRKSEAYVPTTAWLRNCELTACSVRDAPILLHYRGGGVSLRLSRIA
jgi:hypothetical protein